MGLDRESPSHFQFNVQFILEGLATIVIGGVSYWTIVDFPDDANFLNKLEKYVIISRLKSDGQASHAHENLRWQSILASLKDWKTYMGMFIDMGVAGPLYGFSLFLPTIINSFGYTSTRSQLLTVPPYAAAAIMVSNSLSLIHDRQLWSVLRPIEQVVVAFSIYVLAC